jgi:hypothetical protein
MVGLRRWLYSGSWPPNEKTGGINTLLTGGSQGIGPIIGRALASEGINLAFPVIPAFP